MDGIAISLEFGGVFYSSLNEGIFERLIESMWGKKCSLLLDKYLGGLRKILCSYARNIYLRKSFFLRRVSRAYLGAYYNSDRVFFR